jgi:hypothetical protein
LGLAAHLNVPLTLGDLLNLAQNRKGRIDITVDDAFGELESLVRPEGNIRAAIEGGTARHHLSHMDIVADGFTDMAQPAALEKLIQSAGGMEQALEDLTANAQGETVGNKPAAAAEQIQSLIAALPETVRMLQSRNISTRPGHIRAAEALSKSPRALANALANALPRTDIEPDAAFDAEAVMDAIPASDLAPLRSGQSPGQILARIFAALGESGIAPIKELLAVTHGLNGSAEEGFQLPLRINGRIAHLQMYVRNEGSLTADGAKIYLSLDTARLGTVAVYFTLANEGARGLDAVISAQTPAALAALESRQDDLRALAGQAGIEINGLRFILSSEVQPHG